MHKPLVGPKPAAGGHNPILTAETTISRSLVGTMIASGDLIGDDAGSFVAPA